MLDKNRIIYPVWKTKIAVLYFIPNKVFVSYDSQRPTPNL